MLHALLSLFLPGSLDRQAVERFQKIAGARKPRPDAVEPPVKAARVREKFATPKIESRREVYTLRGRGMKLRAAPEVTLFFSSRG